MLTSSTDAVAREEVHGETGNEDADSNFELDISLNLASCARRPCHLELIAIQYLIGCSRRSKA